MKHQKTKIALLFFTVTLLLSIFALLAIQLTYHPLYWVKADKLEQKPANYFSLPNPDQYVLEAIQKPNKGIAISSPDVTQIDEIASDYNTNNIEYNGEYYRVGVIIGDSFPPFMLPQMILVVIVISISALVLLLVQSRKFD
jgi:hypothetical protein